MRRAIVRLAPYARRRCHAPEWHLFSADVYRNRTDHLYWDDSKRNSDSFFSSTLAAMDSVYGLPFVKRCEDIDGQPHFRLTSKRKKDNPM